MISAIKGNGEKGSADGEVVPFRPGSYRTQQPQEPVEVAEETPSMEERRIEIRKDNLSECCHMCVFFIFLVVFTIAMLLEGSASSAHLADHVRQILNSGPISLESVTTTPVVYDYLEQVFIPAMYQNNTDTRAALNVSRSLHPVDVSNRLVGGVRVRQVRVQQSDSCQVGPMFADYKIACYPSLSTGVESKSSFGSDTLFQYSNDPDGAAYTGYFSQYGPSGFMEYLSTNRTAALVKVQQLRTRSFLGNPTRAVFVEFTIWNSNTGTYAVVRLTMEFAASGGVSHDVSVLMLPERSLKAGGFNNGADISAFMGVIIVMCFVTWFLVEELQELYQSPWDYFLDGWNVMDWINMVLLIAAFLMRIMVFVQASSANAGQAAMADRDKFTNLRSLANMVEDIRLLHAINAVLLWGKCAKYFRHLPILKDLIRTVWGSFELFLPFLFMFCIAFMGFSLAYNVGFGVNIQQLSTFGSAVVYLFRAFLKDVELMPVFRESPVFGAVLILLFYVAIVLVGVQVLFAILADALYREKHRTSTEEENELHEDEPVEEFWRFLKWKFPFLSGIHTKLMSLLQRNKATEEEPPEPGATEVDIVVPEGMAGGQLIAFDYDGYHYQVEIPLGVPPGGTFGVKTVEKPKDFLKALEDNEFNVATRKFTKPPTREELRMAIEHMSGKVLSEISIVGIEIKSELHDVCERIAHMHMAVEELTLRAHTVCVDQDRVLK